MKKVYVVVLNWNGFADTLECLESIEKSKVRGFELNVIVVDNASKDISVQKIEKFTKNKKNYSLIVNRSNLGYAAGNNVGVNYALHKKADYVCVLNNDVVVDSDLFVNLFTEAQDRKDGGMFGPKIYFAKGYEFHSKRYRKDQLGKVVWSAGGDIDWKNIYGTNRGLDEVDEGQYDEVEQVQFATGACLFFRALALSKIGTFDERYFMYMEDVDLAVRMGKKWNIYYIPTAKLWHKVSRSSGIGGELSDYFIARNRLLFGLKHASIRAKIALVRESLRLSRYGRPWQKRGVADFYRGNFGKGSWGKKAHST